MTALPIIEATPSSNNHIQNKNKNHSMARHNKKQHVEHHRAPPPTNENTKSKHSRNKSSNHHAATTTATTTTSTSTRVCLKNIPASFTSQQLRDFLTKEYVARQATSNNTRNNTVTTHELIITDCRVLLDKKTQKSRRIAFCGFQSTDMASRVIRLFDATFCLTSRLSVEPAAAKQQQPQQQQQTNQEQVDATNKKDTKTTPKESANKNDGSSSSSSSSSKALMELSSSKGNAKFWSNDLDVTVPSEKEPAAAAPPEPDTDGDSSSEDSDGGDSSDDDADPLANKTINNQRVMTDLDFLKSKQSQLDELDDDDEDINDSDSDDDSEDENVDMKQADKSNQENEENSDSSGSSDSDSDNDDDTLPDSKVEMPFTDQPEITQDKMEEDKNADADDDDNADDNDENKNDSKITSDRLFVRNLPFTTTEEQLEEHFAAFGTVTECHVPVDDRKMSKGFAFVTMDNHQDATRALEALDGGDFQGRYLHILPSRQKPQEKHHNNNDDNNGIHDRPLSYKERQELTRKQEATKSTNGWSASFVRGDAVVDSLADRLGLKKGDILNVKEGLSSGDAAVRLALGETQVIEENREYFKKHGVDMEALVSAKPGSNGKDGIKRSSTSILVKNLPYDTQVEELAKIFHGVGDAPKRILLPPSRTIALVEYGHGSDAKRAFRKLAYRRFKSVPLYLEWAPIEAIGASSDTTEEETLERPSSSKQVLQEDETELEEHALEGPTASIYIKNLNFSTTEEKLRQLFDKHVGDVRAVRIPKKLAPMKKSASNPESEEIQSLSMGFGFVEFASQEAVRKALAKVQGTFLDGHALELKPSTKSLTQASKNSSTIKPPKTKNPTKVMVRNVPFQASRTELLKLFGSFGQLKRVRLPKKFDGGHRGFAFVEFVTHKEALAGMKSLSRTHLYGRHLVLEWAEDETEDPDTGLDALREKAQRDVLQQGGRDGGKGKRQRLS